MVIQDVGSSIFISSSGALICTNYMPTEKALTEENHSLSDSNRNDDENNFPDCIASSPPTSTQSLWATDDDSFQEDEITDLEYFAQFMTPDDEDNDYYDHEQFLENHLNRKQLLSADKYELEPYERPKRANKKMHARRQIKTKHAKSIKYNSHNQELYIHHRLAKIVRLDPPSCSYLASNLSKSHYTQEELKSIVKEDKCNHQTGSNSQQTTLPTTNNSTTHSNGNNNNNNNNTQFRDYTINETNLHVDPTFDDSMIAFLLDMQNRDLSPNDYEMLLRLDDRVQRKTVNESVFDSLPTLDVNESHLNDQCTICMEAYVLGQKLKSLPCEHIFHIHCIEKYLKDFSVQCPLDNLPLM